MLEKPKSRRDFLTPEQNAALVKALPDYLRPLQVVAYDTGARKGELLKLTWSDVDLAAGTLVFHDTKNGEDRLVPLGHAGLKALKALATGDAAGQVFTRNGQPILDFRHAWQSATKAAGLEEHLFHGNRRSQAVNLMAAGIDEQTAMSLTGHKDANTFRSYRVLVEEAKRAAIKQRDAALKAK
jgi:integrase